MNIHKNGESCYLMELSEKEMNFYNITYSNLKNSSDENVKKIILEKCGEKPDRTPEWDILPGLTGGCLIIISFFNILVLNGNIIFCRKSFEFPTKFTFPNIIIISIF